MKKLVVLSAVALMSFSSLCLGASLSSLNNKQVNQTLENKTITTASLITLNGKLLNDNFATVYFGKDNKVNGKFNNKPSSDPQTDEGSWLVKSNGTLCVTWQHWNQAKPICVLGYQLKNALILVNTDTKNLETLILDENIKDGNQVN